MQAAHRLIGKGVTEWLLRGIPGLLFTDDAVILRM